MLDIGWSELIVIGILALLVVGPKELPGLFRTIGQYVGQARGMAREFQRSMEDAARDADGGALNQLRDAKRDFDRMAKVDFTEQAKRSAESLTTPKPPTNTAPAAPAEGTPPKSQAEAPVPQPQPKAEAPEAPAPAAKEAERP